MLAVAPAGEGRAQPSPLPGLQQISPDEEMLVEATQLVYDFEREVVTAEGNVQIYYGPYAVQADRVVYDRKAARLRAEGNVRITEPDGNVVYAETVDLSDDFRDGFVRSLSVETPDRTFISAATAERQADNVTVFNRSVYTACEPCEEDPTKPPLWQVKAVRIIHDRQKEMIYYENASLEFLGVPIAYVPFFSTPDPSVRRKSGFLSPRFHITDMIGFGVEVPYFQVVAPNADITFSPILSTRQVFVPKAEWRHRLANGEYAIRGAGVYQFDPEEETIAVLVDPTTGALREYEPGDSEEWRGTISTEGEFAINRRWSYGFDLTFVSDEAFLDSYNLSDENWITSDIFLRGLSDRNFFHARVARYEHLNDVLFDESTVPLVHPVVDYNYVVDDPIAGGQLSIDVNAYSLSRGDAEAPAFLRAYNADLIPTDDYASASRVVTEAHWRRTVIVGNGQVFTPFLAARGDLYGVDGGYNPSRVYLTDFEARASGIRAPAEGFDDWYPETYEDDAFARFVPTAGLQYRYPFASANALGYQVLEPVAQITYREEIGPEDRQNPNEDALSLVFDASSLFDEDKFAGYDRIETGLRADVGLRYAMNFVEGGSAGVVVGRSIQLAGENPFPEDSGLEESLSDYVGAFYFEPVANLQMGTRARVDGEDFNFERIELFASGQNELGSLSVNYAGLEAQPAYGIVENGEQIASAGSLNVTENWKVFGSTRYDFDLEQITQNEVGVGFANECLTVSLSYSQSYSANDEVDRSVGISINLRTLGGFGTSTGGVGALGDTL